MKNCWSELTWVAKLAQHSTAQHSTAQHSTAQHSVGMDVLDKACQWLCATRKDHSANNSVWHLQWNWDEVKEDLLSRLNNRTYELSPLQVFKINGETLKSWDAKDLLVLKAVSFYISEHYEAKLGESTHLKGKGGIHQALKFVSEIKGNYSRVLKSDVYHYYDSINHEVLFELANQYFNNPMVENIIKQYCERVEIKDGVYFHKNQGIPKGCPLSPIIAALYLKPLQEEMNKMNVPTIIFMDDWISFAKSRWQLRKIIKRTHQVLERLKVRMHPEKTYIGKTNKGFSFLGIDFAEEEPVVSHTALTNHLRKLALCYAEGASKKRIGDYIQRWRQWCQSIYDAVGSENNPPIGTLFLSISHTLFNETKTRSDLYEQEYRMWTGKELTT